MFWAPCVRVDLPVDAPSKQVRWLATALEPLVTILEESDITVLNLAMSAAALRAFDRHGLRPLLDRIGFLAGERRIEMVGTAAHGALLPLLPVEEIARQIDLNDEVNRQYFGDGYHPTCLWAPYLAISLKVADVAFKRDYTSLLVDEGALRVWPGRWEGTRIDGIEGMPGMFLLPSSRQASRAFAEGQVHNRTQLEGLAAMPYEKGKSYVVTTVDLTPRTSPFRALLVGMDRERMVRLEKLFNHFPLDGSTSPLPCSSLSQPEELGRGLPFAPWFSPGNERQAMQWRLVTMLVEVFHSLDQQGWGAVPAVQALRETIDRGWRATWWNEPGTYDEGLARIQVTTESIRNLLPEKQAMELATLLAALAHPPEQVTPTREMIVETRLEV